jgi:hypothetical protein
MTETRIPLTKNQADALRADITELNQMQQLYMLKSAANRRMADMIVRDANLDPKEFPEYELEEKDGKFLMLLKPPKQRTFVNGGEPAQPEVTQ